MTRLNITADRASIYDRACRYRDKLPASISGSGGHTALFNVALVGHGFNLTDDEKFRFVSEWSRDNAMPPWSDAEILHKINSAAKSSKPAGYLLADDDRWSLQTPTTTAGWQEKEDAEKAKKRQGWPVRKPLSSPSWEAVAQLRHLPVEAAYCTAANKYLHGMVLDGHRCFTISEGRFCQARRFDGQPLDTRDGPTKAKTLPGSQGRFIGRRTLGDTDCPVLLVEGVIGLLEGIAAIINAGADEHGWTVLAAVSATSRFEKEPGLLFLLKGRMVTIVKDNDDEGEKAALAWDAELRLAGATTRIYEPPQGCKDIGDMMADRERYATDLAEIFTL